MNSVFAAYAFGRAFHIHLSEAMVQTLDGIVRRDPAAILGLSGSGVHALQRRGLIESYIADPDGDPHKGLKRLWWRATRAGLLVHDLIVEAGEVERLEDVRRQAFDAEILAQREEEERAKTEFLKSVRLKREFTSGEQEE